MTPPTFIRETCAVCTGVGAVGLEQHACPTCAGSGHWLRSVYDERLSGELRHVAVDVDLHLHHLQTGRPVDQRDGYELEDVPSSKGGG